MIRGRSICGVCPVKEACRAHNSQECGDYRERRMTLANAAVASAKAELREAQGKLDLDAELLPGQFGYHQTDRALSFWAVIVEKRLDKAQDFRRNLLRFNRGVRAYENNIVDEHDKEEATK